MASISSVLLSPLTMKDTKSSDLRVSLKSPSSSRKVQCDVCKLSYSSEKELLEHCLSLVHHNKLEEKDENPLHECVLCGVTFPTMMNYRRHIITDMHQKKLCLLKGNHDNKIKRMDDRGSVQTSTYSFLSNTGKDGTDFNKANKQYQIKTGFPEKESPSSDNKNNQYDKQYYNDSNVRYNQDIDSLHTYKWDKDTGRQAFKYKHDKHHWSGDALMGKEYSNQTRIKDNLEEQQRYKQARLTNGYGSYSNDVYLKQWRYDESKDWFGMNNIYPNNGFELNLGADSEIDFTSDFLPTDWDDKPSIENEKLLLGMDSGNQFGIYDDFYTPDIDRLYSGNFRDRKRPLTGGSNLESLAKSSRSVDSSSDESIPVRDVPQLHTPVYENPSLKKQLPSTVADVVINTESNRSSIDDASNNILERAERLCKELKEKREASQVQKNYLVKKQEFEALNERMSALVEKQQSYLKGHITTLKSQQEEKKVNSDINSFFNKQLKQNYKLDVPVSKKSGTGKSEAQCIIEGKMLTGTNNKTAEKSMLNSNGKSYLKNSFLLKHPKKITFRDDTNSGKVSETKDVVKGITNKPKLVAKQHLTKDSLKKMVNTPNSRDERLQLIKMLQSRDEHKASSSIAPRTNLHLEGLYDSVLDSQDLNKDENLSSQRISLEDLSFSVRDQILDLISRDTDLPETNKNFPAKISKGVSTSSVDTNVLSDDEGVKDANKDKINSKKMSNKNSSTILHDIVHTHTKQKLAITVPKGVLKNASASSLTSPSVSKLLHVNNSGNRSTSSGNRSVFSRNRSTSPENRSTLPRNRSLENRTSLPGNKPTLTKNRLMLPGNRPISPALQSRTLHENLILNSNDNGLDTFKNKLKKNSKIFLKEGLQHESPDIELTTKTNSKLSTKPTTDSSNNQVRSPVFMDGQVINELNSTNIVDKFPTLLNTCKADKMLSLKENGSNVIKDSYISNNSFSKFITDFGRSSNKQQIDSSLQANLVLDYPKSDAKSSLLQTTEGEANTQQRLSVALKSASHESDKPVSTPSFFLADQMTPPHSYEQQQFSFNDRSFSKAPGSTISISPTVSSAVEIFRADTTEDQVSQFIDADHSKAEGTNLPDSNDHFTLPGAIDGASNETMSKLLALFEKEEYVKQEKMTMDLRLSRLHRLLEQAVVQINMCSNKMNQLHEEEQDLLKKRLSLLRGL